MLFMRPSRYKRGFTLIEMSIVLVIVGLIVAGALVGRSMVRQSQVMSIMSDSKVFINAVQAFQQKYNALPGDMATATNYWPTAGGGTGDNYTTSCYSSLSSTTPSVKTCNGNGSGVIGDGIQGGSATYISEIFLVWQHLSDAGFIQGSYTGAVGSAGGLDSVPGVNAPLSRIENGIWGMSYYGVLSGTATNYDGNYGHVIALSARNITYQEPINPVLTVAETLNLDTKFDDGLPGTGSITVPKPAMLPNCATSATAYDISAVGIQCLVIMKTGF